MAPSNLNFLNLFLFLSALIFLQCQPAHSGGQNRFIYRNPTSALLTDGIDASVLKRPTTFVTELESLKPNVSSESYCEQTYGFMPCTKTAIGNLFLLAVYGFFMFKSASFLTDGSEVLLDVLGPGIVGALFLPILGALPDTLLIVVSGISGSKETAQQQVVIGMGLLAGSTVMLVTALWGACLVVGKCDLSLESEAIDSKDTKGFSRSGSGVTVDKSTRKASWIMVASIVPFIIAQIPLIFNLKSGKHASVLVACILALLSLLGYCLFQIYGAVTMNNTLCLGVFLAIVYLRGLDWDFSAEVLVILVVVIVTGIIGSIYTTLKLWMSAIAFLLYPLSLVMVYVLDYKLGWT